MICLSSFQTTVNQINESKELRGFVFVESTVQGGLGGRGLRQLRSKTLPLQTFSSRVDFERWLAFVMVSGRGSFGDELHQLRTVVLFEEVLLKT